MDIEEFKKNVVASKKSKLFKYESDILSLRKDGYTFARIVEFLKLNGCQVTSQAVHQWVQRYNAKKASSPENKSNSDGKNEFEKPAFKSDTSDHFDWNNLKNTDPKTLY